MGTVIAGNTLRTSIAKFDLMISATIFGVRGVSLIARDDRHRLGRDVLHDHVEALPGAPFLAEAVDGYLDYFRRQPDLIVGVV